MAFYPSQRAEHKRVSALRRYAILDTLAERSFDELTQLAAYIAKTPIALISFVDRDRQWFKSKFGLDIEETPRSQSFCAYAILEPEKMLVVPDALSDPRFANNPLVVDQPNIRFYCGAPLVTPDGHTLGNLCVIDRIPRTLDAGQKKAIEALSHQTMVLMELRKLTTDLFEGQRSPRALAG